MPLPNNDTKRDGRGSIDSDPNEKEMLRAAIAIEHERNRQEIRNMIDKVIDHFNKEKKEYEGSIDEGRWFLLFNSALNKTGSVTEAEELANRAMSVYRDKYPKKKE